MSKLDEILRTLAIMRDPRGETEAKQQIKQLFLDLVGDDEQRPASGAKRNGIEQGLRRTRNRVRVELRAKIKEL